MGANAAGRLCFLLSGFVWRDRRMGDHLSPRCQEGLLMALNQTDRHHIQMMRAAGVAYSRIVCDTASPSILPLSRSRTQLECGVCTAASQSSSGKDRSSAPPRVDEPGGPPTAGWSPKNWSARTATDRSLWLAQVGRNASTAATRATSSTASIPVAVNDEHGSRADGSSPAHAGQAASRTRHPHPTRSHHRVPAPRRPRCAAGRPTKSQFR